MCTAITMSAADGTIIAARTMDFSYPLDPRLIRITTSKYHYEGVGQNAGDDDENTVLFADGVNECGLFAAALYFPGFAKYDEPRGVYGSTAGKSCCGGASSDTLEIAAYGLVPYLLGSCGSVSHAVSVIHSLRIIGVPDAVTGIAAPLHWLLADRSGKCVTVEKTAAGLRCYNNPIGVLANSPDFGWHMTNLRNYINITASPAGAAAWDNVHLAPFGQGGGSFGLPGDFTPPSRFVRAAWLKTHAAVPADYNEALAHCRMILGNVSLPKGCVITGRGTIDYTQYTVFFNLNEATCIFKKYGD